MTADALERQAFTLLAEIRRCIENDQDRQALRKVDYLESLVRAGGVERTPEQHAGLAQDRAAEANPQVGQGSAAHPAPNFGAVEPPARWA